MAKIKRIESDSDVCIVRGGITVEFQGSPLFSINPVPDDEGEYRIACDDGRNDGDCVYANRVALAAIQNVIEEVLNGKDN